MKAFGRMKGPRGMKGSGRMKDPRERKVAGRMEVSERLEDLGGMKDSERMEGSGEMKGSGRMKDSEKMEVPKRMKASGKEGRPEKEQGTRKQRRPIGVRTPLALSLAAAVLLVFSAANSIMGIPIKSLFSIVDIPDYKAYDPEGCSMCKDAVPIDAFANAYGYSRIG